MILKFGVISGVGWLLDVCLFYAGTQLGLPFWLSNAVGALVAVTFVFMASVRKVFLYHGQYVWRMLGIYVTYQVVAIFIASAAIDWIAQAIHHPLLAKIMVTPVTFYCNFLFMNWLTRGKLHWR